MIVNTMVRCGFKHLSWLKMHTYLTNYCIAEPTNMLNPRPFLALSMAAHKSAALIPC